MKNINALQLNLTCQKQRFRSQVMAISRQPASSRYGGLLPRQKCPCVGMLRSPLVMSSLMKLVTIHQQSHLQQNLENLSFGKELKNRLRWTFHNTLLPPFNFMQNRVHWRTFFLSSMLRLIYTILSKSSFHQLFELRPSLMQAQRKS
ncbi:hypothetical protein GCK32_017867 [Trichostrongylus colubriformis]|uniref:Uncharacterized protein n=1 Tax=Trichostrongylus colubriformis TaxID=6319 RepID=A0AAN8FI24_TRICO